MIKKLMIATAATLALTGCVAVPVYDTGPAYGYYYAPPAATFSFGYYRGYGDGGRHRHGRGYGHRYSR
ncbi:MAG: hypothetical protein EHM59_16660 [Betaproteobacteria bacterium]|nr:MAG: hypothetical protein EHM59_16660 [Betaproteobacteria bacterium]